jgi:uncharacterized membrane protein YhdT
VKLSTFVKKLGKALCLLGAFCLVFLFWQLFAYESSLVPGDLSVLCYVTMACVILLPVMGVWLIRYSVTLMLRCR